MSAPGWSDWYVENHLHFLQDGLDYWWNDEGETQWFTYTWWNAAQQLEYAQALPGQRFWTLNRAFQPGMQRFPAVTWTGDRQDCAHDTVLTFTTAGQPYTACDMTAPDATVLVRQYQNAVFLPIMRTHAMHGVPRFPYYWGGEEHQVAFRGALNMRYAFVPHIYSLAHLLRATGQPIALPASYIFPNDATFPVSIGDSTYMVSDVLLPADVSTSNGNDPNENTTHVNIPPGTWYTFNSTQTIVGPQAGLTYTNVALSELMLFVRSGAILCLNKAVVQYTDALGGDLVVQVYAGRDGSFTLVEDDGTSLEYQLDDSAATRRTAFTWNNAARTLSWTVSEGYITGPNLYNTVWPVLMDGSQPGAGPEYHAPVALAPSGSVSF
jgi:alpha-glucosidase (family GH31 glycosyl hydrolase)